MHGLYRERGRTMSKYLDLRCRLRLTVQDGYHILDALDHTGAEPKRLRAKIQAAITMATHSCDRIGSRGMCSVCGQSRDAVAQTRQRQARDFVERLSKSKAMQAKEDARQRELVLRSPPPALRLAKESGE